MPTHIALKLAALLLCAISMVGCSSAPALTHTGFLSSYDRLETVNDNRMRYIAPELKNYQAFIIDPVQISSQKGQLKPEDRAEIATYFRESLVKVLGETGYKVTSTPGVGTARIRVALTNVQDSKWWMKVHPVGNLAGGGRGGASMESEIIDSVTGEQLAAVVQAGTGSQFTAFNYSTVSDIKSTIDEWARNAGQRLAELRASAR